MVNLNGLMERNIRDNGKMEICMVKEYILTFMVKKKKENGMTESVFDGFKKKMNK